MNTEQRIYRSISVVVCSQGIQSAPVESVSEHAQGFVRSSEGGANQLRLDGDDVRIASLSATGDARPGNNFNDGHEGLDCGEAATEGATSNCPSTGIASRRVSLRSPAPLPEGLDSEASSSSTGLEDTSELDRSSVSAAEDVEPTGANDVIAEPDAPKNSFERFARARAAGRELAKRNKEGGGLGSATEDEDYYTPVIGDYVMGIVASGTFSKLDINIGAKQLGHLFRKDVMPLDLCDTREMSWEFSGTNSPGSEGVFAPPHGIRFVRDEEVLNLALEAPMVVELGTVLAMEVKGMTPSGRALLSARSVAREYAWQRVRQVSCCCLLTFDMCGLENSGTSLTVNLLRNE